MVAKIMLLCVLSLPALMRASESSNADASSERVEVAETVITSQKDVVENESEATDGDRSTSSYMARAALYSVSAMPCSVL